MSEMNGPFDLQVATSYLLQVYTTPAPHDLLAVFRSESAIADLSEQENRNSGFESKQKTVAVTVFSEAERGNQKFYLNQSWTFA